MSKDVKFNIKINIDGKEGIGIVTTDVKKLRQSFDEARSSSGQLRDKLITFNQVIGVVQNMSSAVNNLRDVMSGLASSYNAVQQSNALLDTVMRQRIAAAANCGKSALHRQTAATCHLPVGLSLLP